MLLKVAEPPGLPIILRDGQLCYRHGQPSIIEAAVVYGNNHPILLTAVICGMVNHTSEQPIVVY